METMLPNEKQIQTFHNGKVVVISPKNLDKIIVPFFCPICEYPMKTADDAQSYRDYQCCSMCELYWGRSGIQPEKDSQRWKLFMERRHMAFLPQIQFK